MDISKAFDLDQGIILTDENGNEGPFYTGGPSSPIGLDLPEKTIYAQNTVSGIILWVKYGSLSSEWRKYPAVDISFDPSLVDISNTNVQGAIEALASRNYGKDFAEQIKEVSESTSGGTFDVYDTLNFTVNDTSGTNKYRLSFNYFWGHSSASNDIRVEHRLDGVNIFQMRQEPGDQGNDQRIDGTFIHYVENLGI